MTINITHAISAHGSPITIATSLDGSQSVEIRSIVIPGAEIVVDELASENEVLKTWHENVGSVKSQMESIMSVNPASTMDVTYMGGLVARTDYSIGTTQGQAIVEKLQATWSNEIPSFTTNPSNLVAEYPARRPPYTNNSISFYNFEEPSNAIKTTFNATYKQYNPWYGLKFDTVTEDVLAKFVIPAKEMQRVDPTSHDDVVNKLPGGSYHFYARLHDKSNTVFENVDVYFSTAADIMETWCTENSYTFPYDKTDITIEPAILIWGCVYNTTNKTFTHIKAYTREEI